MASRRSTWKGGRRRIGTRNEKEYLDAKTWVDMWVTEDEDGFVEVARRFGID